MDAEEGWGTVLGCGLASIISIVGWLVPIALGIWVLQAMGCVS